MVNNNDADVPFRHNSAASRHGVVICVEVDFNVAIDMRIEHGIVEWVTRALRAAHSEMDAANLWHYVHGVRHDQWQDEHQPHTRMNGIQVTVAFGQLSTDDYNWPLFPNEEAERPRIDAGDVLQHFDEHMPLGVVGLGVSALQRTKLREEWHETITDGPTTFCRPGMGAGVHWMRTLHSLGDDTCCPFISRERADCIEWV